MAMYFCPNPIGFYNSDVTSEIPSGMKKLTKDEYKKFSNPTRGSKLSSDESGNPILIDVEIDTGTIDSLLARAKKELRTMRAPMLDALTGIAGRAARSGNEALAIEADMLSEQLLDITDDPALNAATDYESMQAAGVAAYKRIAASASNDLKIVFREITGA